MPSLRPVLPGVLALALLAIPQSGASSTSVAEPAAADRIGRSVDGQPILARHQGSRTGPQRILVVGSLHGDQVRGHAVVRALRHAALPASVQLWTIRSLNPDGVSAGHPRNSHGVDLGRNFPLRWTPGPGAGPAAASEPETRLLMRFIRKIRPQTVVLLDGGDRVGISTTSASRWWGRAVAAAARAPYRQTRCPGRCHGAPARWLDALAGTRAAVISLADDTGAARVRAIAGALLEVAVTRPAPDGTATTPPAPPPPAPGSPFLPYTAGSYFRTPAPAAVDIAATTSFRAFMKSDPDQAGTPYPLIRGVAGNSWGTTYAEGTAADPVWRLTGSVPSEVGILATKGFHAPAWFGQMLSGTGDSPFVVVDRAHGWSVWGSRSKVVGDHLVHVASAGLFEHASNGLDKRNPLSNSTLNFRSRGAIPDAMVIRRDLVDWGVAHGTDLGHVLHLFMVETDSSAGHRHPMVGSEAGNSGWGAEGQRIAIDPSVDLTTRGLSPEALVIARTLQRFGAYIGDNAGGPTSLKAEQENSVRDVWGGRLKADSLHGITWDDFVVLTH
jgi:hypothetical protein